MLIGTTDFHALNCYELHDGAQVSESPAGHEIGLLQQTQLKQCYHENRNYAWQLLLLMSLFLLPLSMVFWFRPSKYRAYAAATPKAARTSRCLI